MNYVEQISQLIGQPSTHALAVCFAWLAWRVEKLRASTGAHGYRLHRLERWTNVPAGFDPEPEPESATN